jgi:hypothetical protein
MVRLGLTPRLATNPLYTHLTRDGLSAMTELHQTFLVPPISCAKLAIELTCAKSGCPSAHKAWLASALGGGHIARGFR